MRFRSETKSPAAAGLLLLVLVALGGCAERPYIGVEITNAPRPHQGDCIPGSPNKPCP